MNKKVVVGLLTLILVGSLSANGYLYWQQRQLRNRIVDNQLAAAQNKIDMYDLNQKLSNRIDQVVDEASEAGRNAVQQQVSSWAQQSVREGLPGRVSDLEDRVDELTTDQSSVNDSYLLQCVRWLAEDHGHGSLSSLPPSACRLMGF